MDTPARAPPMVRTRGASVMESLSVLDEAGAQVQIQSLWKSRRILLVMLRHFGCRFCKQQVASLKLVHERLKASGTGLVLISLGTPEQIPRFREEMAVPASIEIYVDAKPDSPVAHALFRLRSSRDCVVGNPSVAALGKGALAQGFEDGGYANAGGGPYTGDVFQVGGVFILGAGSVCDYAFRSQHAGDHPDPATLLEAATGVRRDGGELTYPATTQWLDRLQAGEPAAAAHPRPAATPAHPHPHPHPRGNKGILAGLGAIELLCALSALVAAAVAALAQGLPRAATAVLAGLALTLALVGAAVAARTRRRRGGGAGGSLPAAASVRLLSPEDVDCLALRRQLVQCDCARVTEGTDMTTPSKEFSTEEVVGIDTLGTLDALGALREEGAADADADDADADADADGGAGLSNADVHQLRLANCYMREFLSKPHPLLGRAGPTCPFVPRALKLGSMRVAIIRSGPRRPPPEAELRALVRGFLPIFEALEPQRGPTAVFKALLLLFPDVPLAEAPRLIDGTQAALKEECVAKGLMLGEFHLANNATGLHSQTFYPLRTVCPTLAIRHMVPNDLVFLTGAQYDDRKRAAFLRAYVAKMEGAKGAKGAKAQGDVEKAQQLLAELEAA